jgi:tetrapyrrole methylase family protein/MazG family protein
MPAGLDFLTPTLTALKLDNIDNLQISYAETVGQTHHPPLEPGRPTLIPWLNSPELARRVQRSLLNAYPGQTTVTLVQAGTVRHCLLTELGEQPNLGDATHLYLPALESAGDFSVFQKTIAHLRSPNGCPWDREQTHQSLRPYLLEEAYEVLDTLDRGDHRALAEELGDLLLQVLLHTQIAIERNEFNMSDVIGHINRKLWRRHPHVFGDVTVNSVEDVTANWEAIKKTERRNNHNNNSPAAVTPSALDGVPNGLPALVEALIISKKAVRVGFEWSNIEEVLDKLIEEAREITQAETDLELESEIGDFLFSAVNLARWRNIDPESALRTTNARFRRRFTMIETLAARQGQSLEQMSIAEMDALWNEAKRLEQKG